MPKPRVFITRGIADTALRKLSEVCDADVWPLETPPSYEELARRASLAEGLLSLLTDRVDALLIGACPSLRVISNCAVGVDNVDVRAATQLGIPVGNTPGVLTDATADLTMALLLAAARRVIEGNDYVRAGNWKTWDPHLLLGADLAGSTLGLIGFGRIGRAVARRAQGFDLRITYYDPAAEPEFGARPVKLDDLLRQSDFISLHVPLTDSTRHMMNSETFSKMKASAILINTSRGPIVDHEALFGALEQRRILAAALDVTEPEPLSPESPLLKLDNCIVLPHLGSASNRTREQMALLAADNLIAGLKRERLPHCVNPEVYS